MKYNFKFNIRQKIGGIILEVTAEGTSLFINEFHDNYNMDELNEEGISNAFLRLQKRLENELAR